VAKEVSIVSSLAHERKKHTQEISYLGSIKLYGIRGRSLLYQLFYSCHSPSNLSIKKFAEIPEHPRVTYKFIDLLFEWLQSKD